MAAVAARSGADQADRSDSGAQDDALLGVGELGAAAGPRRLDPRLVQRFLSMTATLIGVTQADWLGIGVPFTNDVPPLFEAILELDSASESASIERPAALHSQYEGVGHSKFAHPMKT